MVRVNPPTEGEAAGDVPAADICTALARHAVTCRATEQVRPRESVGKTLLEVAEDFDVNLMVMARHGHSRFRELSLDAGSHSPICQSGLDVALSAHADDPRHAVARLPRLPIMGQACRCAPSAAALCRVQCTEMTLGWSGQKGRERVMNAFETGGDAIATAGMVGASRRSFWRRMRSLGRSIPLAVLATLAMLWQAPAASSATVFDSLIGSWSGQGQIRYDNGQAEGIRCTAYYTGGGNSLHMAIRCNSSNSNTQVEIRGQLTAEGDKLSGSWEERTFNASGQVTGHLAGGKMSLSIVGGGFKGAMSVASAGGKQVVTISTEGIKMRSVNVTLGKA